MQYVGSPQTTFRFGSTPTRSMSISSLASMVESGEDPELSLIHISEPTRPY